MTEPLRAALTPIKRQIVAAFVYGSVAKGTDTVASDIDLMVVSDQLATDLFAVLEQASRAIGRTVNPTILTRKDLTRNIGD